MWETWVWSLEEGMATHSSILAWRTPWTTVHGVAKSQTQLSNFYFDLGFPSGSAGKKSACSAADPVQSPSQEDLLEKEMVTHSSILAWRIPWTQERDRLQPMESQGVRHNCATNIHFFFQLTYWVSIELYIHKEV